MTGAVGETKCCKCCSGHNWERAGDQFFGPPSRQGASSGIASVPRVRKLQLSPNLVEVDSSIGYTVRASIKRPVARTGWLTMTTCKHCVVARATGRALDDLRGEASRLARSYSTNWCAEPRSLGTAFCFENQNVSILFVAYCRAANVPCSSE